MSAYLKFFQLEKSPFDTRAQSALVLGTKALRGAFAEIEAGLEDAAPRICVDGKAGLGKTSLARALPKLLGESARVVLILNPSLPWSTLRSAIVKQLDLAEGNLSRKTLMRARSEGRRLVIVVDQAERISSESLDHLDILLGYKNDDDQQLVHCVLLANLQAAASQHNEQGEQTPLLWWLDKLNTLQLEFQPIPSAGVTSYVNKHLKRAGWKGGQIFTADALQTIHRLTGGVPREMSELCERALELAAEEGTSEIDAQLVEDVFGEIPLEELVDDDPDLTDSMFVGARDDHAQANTTTFGGTAPPPPEAAPFSEPTSALDAEVTDTLQADDPRIDRMPTPGRSVHAPVEAPVSLDSFFGDSLDGPSVRATPPLPEETTDPFDPLEAATEAPPAAEASFDDTDVEAASPERSWIKWAGIAAGALVVLGGGSFAALSLLGGSDSPDEPPAVLARPKPAPSVQPPIAGIEPIRPDAQPAIEPIRPGAQPANEPTTGSEEGFVELGGMAIDPLDADLAAAAAEPGATESQGVPSPDAPDRPGADAPSADVEAEPAPAAPAFEDPAETEVDAPYW